ncbi:MULTISPECIES: CD3324 family protein [unclassified Paenibacillus]|uniref:CD3324 family protein n=1 Tax=unclassified Paenibacillus TaxID=185978 RepID=UPI0036B872BB
MKYQNAQRMLPEELLHSIQEYVQAGYLYIPARQGKKKQWGECSGYKQMLQDRNEEIMRNFRSGLTVKELAHHYYLSERSIRRIIRSQ